MPSERLWLSDQAAARRLPSLTFRVTETVLAGVGLAVLTNGPSIVISHLYNVPLGWDSWPYLVPMGAVALVGCFLCGRDLTIADLRRNRWPIAALAAYLLWCAFSVTWSVAPNQTAVRSVVTAGVAAFGLWYGLSLRFKEQLLGLFLATTTLCVWSLLLIWIQPHTHQLYPPSIFPNWHTEAMGVFGNPNSLGPVAALSVMTSIAVWLLFPSWWARLSASGAFVVGLVLTIGRNDDCDRRVDRRRDRRCGDFRFASPQAYIRLVRQRIDLCVTGRAVEGVLRSHRPPCADGRRRHDALQPTTDLERRRATIALRPWRGYRFFVRTRTCRRSPMQRTSTWATPTARHTTLYSK